MNDNNDIIKLKEKNVGNKIDIEIKKLDGNPVFQHGKKFKQKPMWIVVHYTAVVGASAKNMAKSYSRTDRKVSTHFFCDSKDIYSVVPEEYIAWHCGDGKVLQPFKNKNLTLDDLIAYGDTSNWRFKLAAENHKLWKKNGTDITGNSYSLGVDICTIKGNKVTGSVKDDDWDANPLAILNAAKLCAYLCKKYNIPLNRVVRHADFTGKPCPRFFVSLSGDKNKNLNDKRWVEFKEMIGGYL